MKSDFLINMCIVMIFFYLSEKIGRLIANEIYACGFHDGLQCSDKKENGIELVRDKK